jgi:hypothetical protein
MNLYKYILVLTIPCLMGCAKRNFYPDQYNPGLSRFTSQGYDIMSVYIDDTAFANPFSPFRENAPVEITKDSTNSIYDTLSISWQLGFSDTTNHNLPPYQFFSILIPVDKSFSLNDLFGWDGKIFPSNGTTVTTKLITDNGPTTLIGSGRIYVVNIAPPDTSSSPGFIFSGLFEGAAGSNQITKGRFDFTVYESDLNFR